MTILSILLATVIGVAHKASAATVCSPATAISVPYVQNGVADVCLQASSLCTYINSWNTTTVEVNGTAYTNLYTAASSIAPLNGGYTIHYVSTVGWGHFEIGGTCASGPTNTTAPATNTSIPVTATRTNTPFVATATRTNAPVTVTVTRTNTLAAATNTSVPATATRTNTPVAATNTVAAATNTPIVSSGALKVQMSAAGTDNTQQTAFNLRIVNTGSSAASNISARIYFTTENSNAASSYVLEKYYDQSGVSTVSGPTLLSGSTYYYTINFGTASLPAGGNWAYNTAMHLSTWASTFNSSNDFWHGTSTLPAAFTDWSTIPAYVSGSLVWGGQPDGIASPTATLIPTLTPTRTNTAGPSPTAGPTATPGADTIGNATWFTNLGAPYGGCGINQSALDTPHFVALNVQDSPGDYSTFLTRPISSQYASQIGAWNNGLNCGRWVRVTISDYCTGVNDGAINQPFCRNGSWIQDAYNGATLDMIIADSCHDPNAWCRDDRYHLDLAEASLNQFVKNGVMVGDMNPAHWGNRHVAWHYIPAPNYTGDIKIAFIQGAQVYWPAIVVNHLVNGIHGVDSFVNGAWVKSTMNGDMGQSYIISPTTTGGSTYQIRVYDVNDQLINGGRIYNFTFPSAACGSQCSGAYNEVTYTIQ